VKSLVGLLLVLSVIACGEDGPMTDPGTTAALERQRDDVRAATAGLLDAARSELGVEPEAPSGAFRGCESAFDQEFRSFRYLSQVRVDLASGADPGVSSRRLLQAAGFAPEAEPTPGPGDRRSLHATKGDLDAVVADTGAGAFLLVRVAGPCVEVPEGDRRNWLTREG
jgi:hypothetical protein